LRPNPQTDGDGNPIVPDDYFDPYYVFGNASTAFGCWLSDAGGTLPSRIDQLVLFQNLKAKFQETYYWSCEEYRSDVSYAWVQHFGGGNQVNDRKDVEFPVRAVRRVPIQ
jgi:hypothetical protein